MSSTTTPDSRGEDMPSSVALDIERAGQQATRAALREHLQSGRAVYYTDPAYPEDTIKERPDGRRLLVRLEKPEGDQSSD